MKPRRLTPVRTSAATLVRTSVGTLVCTLVRTSVCTSVSTLVCTSVATLVCTLVLTAQAPRPTFRGGINYVSVDMYATADGKPVNDLRQDEIELIEDGAPQLVKDFEHVVVRTNTPVDIRVEPNTVEESRQMAADPRARVFVLFLDTYHTKLASSYRMRQPLTRFIDRLLGPDDMVAIMTPEMAASDVTFARKTTVIDNILRRDWNWGRRGNDARSVLEDDPREQFYKEWCGPDKAGWMIERRREKLSLDALEDLVEFLRGIREERKAVVTISEGWLLYEPDRKLEPRYRPDDTPPIPRIGPIRGGDQGHPNYQIECDADQRTLANLDHRSRIQTITDAANRSNVTFYPVNPAGLAVFDEDDIMKVQTSADSVAKDQENLRKRFYSLTQLSQDTDGTAVVNTNDVAAGMTRIVSDLSSYYLLGYESTNNKLDGKVRSIRVRVKRPGVTVRARKGYRAFTADEVAARGAVAPAPVAAAALPAVVVNARAPFRVRSTTWMGDTSAMLWLVGEMDLATRRDPEWSRGATAEISVVSLAGDRVATLQARFTTAEGGFSVQVPPTTAIDPGDYQVRVRVTSTAGQGLPLSDLVRVRVPAAPMPMGEPVMLRRGPSSGTRYVSTADPRFQRSERIRLELPTRAAGAPAAQVLDASGKPMPLMVTLSERPDDAGFRWIVADATLAPLAPGDYAIEVTLADARQVTPFRVVP